MELGAGAGLEAVVERGAGFNGCAALTLPAGMAGGAGAGAVTVDFFNDNGWPRLLRLMGAPER